MKLEACTRNERVTKYVALVQVVKVKISKKIRITLNKELDKLHAITRNEILLITESLPYMPYVSSLSHF